MKILILLLLLIPTFSYCQCNSDQIIYIDSLGIVIDSAHNNQGFIINNGTDTIKLEQLYSINSTTQTNLSPFNFDNEKDPDSRAGYCVKCFKKQIKIIDSIDINKDGVKEVILFREWYCSASPPGLHPYGVGTETEVSSQYEVWDIKSKNQLFKVKNRLSTSITTSTNVGYSDGYRFDVTLSKKGVFKLSNTTKKDCGYEMGVYKYNKENEDYIKE